MIGEEELIQMVRQLADLMDQVKHWRGFYIAVVEELARLAPEKDALRVRVAELEGIIAMLEDLGMDESRLLTEAQDRIREFEAERRWVPVNENLPESDTVGCLVIYRCFSDGAEDVGIEAPAWYSSRNGHWHDRGGEYIDWHYLNDGCEVLAWMVAPEPYRGATIREGPVSRAEALQISHRILERAEAERTAQEQFPAETERCEKIRDEQIP